MDWHHPDGAKCADDEQARRRFVDYIHGHVREICTNYGKLDVLWYDVAWPLDAAGWESQKMNDMVFQLQPDILVNNRNKLAGDFSTPEQRIVAADKDWEACMTMNDSWGYHKADDDWKSPKTIVRNLATCAQDGGNYLLNIGPLADGSIPPESVKILQRCRQVDGRKRRNRAPVRTLPGTPPQLRQLYSQREYVVHARAFLARGRTSGLQRTKATGEVGAAACFGKIGEFRAGQVSCAVDGTACQGAGFPHHHVGHRVRRRANAGLDFRA